MTYTYDVLNRLATAKDNRVAGQGGPSNPTTYSYDPAGNRSGYLYPNAIQTSNLFDTINRLTQTCSATSSPACSAPSKLSSFAYTLGAAGNRTAVSELSGRNVSYGYDNDYRLLTETVASDPGSNNGTETYTYDNVGNRLTLSSTIPALPGSVSYSYDPNDRLLSDGYDNNGSTIFSLGTTNTYDFENHLLQHGSTVTIIYDGDGNRVSETVGSTTTKFLVDDRNPTGYSQVLDESVNGSVTRTYSYGLRPISENQLVSGSWIPSFYGFDGHGNVRFLSNTAGVVTDTYQFDSYGMPIAFAGTTANNFQYNGELLDSNLSLYNLRGRWYNALTGRFETMDPYAGMIADPATLHKYIFVRNDPINRIDPNGYADFEEYTIGLYSRIKAAANAVGLEAHHIIPARFAVCFGVAAGEMLAVALNPNTHQEFDNAWADAIPQNGFSSCAEAGDVLAHALVIYEDDPDILAWLKWWYQIK